MYINIKKKLRQVFFIFFLCLWALRLNLGYKKDNKLKNYAKIEILKYSLFNLKKVKKILDKNVIHNLMFIEDKKGVDNLIKSLK